MSTVGKTIKLSIEEHGLGRRHAPDERDQAYMLAPPKRTERTHRSWYDNGWWGDQGATPMCVGYAWAHYIEDSPVTHPKAGAQVQPEFLYHAAQLVDEWPGTDYEGTSVRAGAKALQKMGIIGEYLWAPDMAAIAKTVLEQGPVIMGTDWYNSMFEPDSKGLLSLDTSSGIAGGHAYVVNGYNVWTNLFRIKNSWSRSWGIKGHALIHADDLGRLLAADGEACMTKEIEIVK